MGMFSLMCLLKRLVRSTLSVGKLMKPTQPLESIHQTTSVLSPDYLFRSFRLRSLSQNVILAHPPATLRTWHEDQVVIRASGSLIDLREDGLQIVTVSTLHKVSNLRRHRVFHPEQFEVQVK